MSNISARAIDVRHIARRRALPLCLCAALASIASTSLAQTQDYVPPVIDTQTPTGVTLVDGSFGYSQVDISIGPLTLERFSRGGARDPADPFFGPRVSHNFDIYVAPNPTPPLGQFLPARYKPIVHLGNSASGVYTQSLSDLTSINDAQKDALAAALDYVSGAYVYTAHDGTIYTFNPSVPAEGNDSNSQRVASIVYPGGRKLNFTYVSDQLKLITDNSGYALVFDYNGSGLVSAACGFNLAVTYVTSSTTCSGAALKTTYGYTSGVLTSVVDVMGYTTNYTASEFGVSCVRPPGHATCRIANTGGWQTTGQTLADSTVWAINPPSAARAAGARTPDEILEEDPTTTTTVTDPAGQTSTYAFSRSSPYLFTDPLGRETSFRFTGGYQYEWLLQNPPPPELNQGSMLLLATYPEGNKYEGEYSGPFNSISRETFTPKPGSELSNAVIEYGYGTCPSAPAPGCTRPIWRTDPRGNRTDFAYTSFGSIQSEMQPAPSAGAPRPLKLYTYEQRYAYIKNSGGSLVPAATPIWLLLTETQCQTVSGSGNSNPVCDTGAASIVTEYTYGANGTANNLLPASVKTRAGNDSVSATIAMTYTNSGDVASRDGPRTDVVDISYFTYDAMRRTIFEIGPDPDGASALPRVITKHTYSPDGNETRVDTGYGNATDGSSFTIQRYRAMSYDGLGRVTRTDEGRP